MAEIVKCGDSIEGRKLKGSSRKPISYKGLIKENGKRLHKFTTKFNSKSSIKEPLEDNDAKIDNKANTSVNDEIICDDVFLRSIDRRYSREKESNASATHSAFAWVFPKQTNCMITKSHEDIENAMRKRELAEMKKLKH